MRPKLVLIVVSLFVVTIATGVAGAATSAGEHNGDAKLDKLHAVRPIAASARTRGSTADPDTLAHDLLVALAEAAIPPAPVAPREPAPAPEAPPAAAPVVRAAPVPQPVVVPAGIDSVLACIRRRESGGDYTVHNSWGSGASGAYQFMPPTWDSIAAATGRSDLIGVDPAAAAPADQDALALALFQQQGRAPWGGAC
jgi:hypothetical protein